MTYKLLSFKFKLSLNNWKFNNFRNSMSKKPIKICYINDSTTKNITRSYIVKYKFFIFSLLNYHKRLNGLRTHDSKSI